MQKEEKMLINKFPCPYCKEGTGKRILNSDTFQCQNKNCKGFFKVEDGEIFEKK